MFHLKKIFCFAILGIVSIIATYAQKPVYGYAYCTNLKDSVVYLTAIQQLPEAQIGKHNFLNYRADYGQQFSQYINQFYNIPYVTTILYFDKSRSALERRYLKTRNTAKYQQRKQIVEVSFSEFKFKEIQ